MEVEPEDVDGEGADKDAAGAERRRLMKGAALGVALGAFLAVAARFSGRRTAVRPGEARAEDPPD